MCSSGPTGGGGGGCRLGPDPKGGWGGSTDPILALVVQQPLGPVPQGEQIENTCAILCLLDQCIWAHPMYVWLSTIHCSINKSTNTSLVGAAFTLDCCSISAAYKW